MECTFDMSLVLILFLVPFAVVFDDRFNYLISSLHTFLVSSPSVLRKNALGVELIVTDLGSNSMKNINHSLKGK